MVTHSFRLFLFFPERRIWLAKEKTAKHETEDVGKIQIILGLISMLKDLVKVEWDIPERGKREHS